MAINGGWLATPQSISDSSYYVAVIGMYYNILIEW